MNPDNVNDLAAALQDLRSAYRLVYAYQRRTNEIAGHLTSALDGAGLEFQRWDPVFFSRPCRSSNPYWSDHSAWDMLPGFALGLLFESGRRMDALFHRVLVQFIADTGFEKRGGEPDPVQFTSVEEADSVIRYSILRSPTKIPEYGGVQPFLTSAGDQVYDGNEHHIFGDGHDFSYRWCELGLTELSTSQAVQELLVRPIVERLRSPYPTVASTG